MRNFGFPRRIGVPGLVRAASVHIRSTLGIRAGGDGGFYRHCGGRTSGPAVGCGDAQRLVGLDQLVRIRGGDIHLYRPERGVEVRGGARGDGGPRKAECCEDASGVSTPPGCGEALRKVRAHRDAPARRYLRLRLRRSRNTRRTALFSQVRPDLARATPAASKV